MMNMKKNKQTGPPVQRKREKIIATCITDF